MRARELTLISLFLLSSACSVYAGEQSKDAPAKAKWTLATDDTELQLSVLNDKIFVNTLKNPTQAWNWTPATTEVPLPGEKSVAVGATEYAPHWKFVGAKEDRTDGYTVTLTFASAMPKLRLKSVWQARSGQGPVENWVTIENQSGGNVIFSPDIVATRLNLQADGQVRLHRAEKTQVDWGKVHYAPLGPKATVTTGNDMIPLMIFDVGEKHGLYLGFEWEIGGFQVKSGDNPMQITASVHPITEKVTRGNGQTFLIPSVYYGTYQGDVDDGSNALKRWFWKYKITRSLHDNPGEPWVEACAQEAKNFGTFNVPGMTGNTPQKDYDWIASTGVECIKFDWWDGTGQNWYTNRDWQYHPETWPNGFDFAIKAHKAGMKASLYLGGTYKDCDPSTIAGRDAELAAVLKRYDAGWFDMWRTDWCDGKEPIPQTYEGVTNFLYIQDYMIKNRPNYRWENCANGGRYKSFAICRRMTFCTMNDRGEKDSHLIRSTFYSNSFAVCPTQLKSDYAPNSTPYEMRTHMLGAILSYAADRPAYREHIALYKAKQRPILRGANVYHILPIADGVNWDGLEYFNPELRKGSAFIFKPSVKAVDGDSKTIKLKGLDRKKQYALTFQDRTNLNCVKTGAELMDVGVLLSGMTGDQASEIIWIDEQNTAATSP
jgi:hypothetical protein